MVSVEMPEVSLQLHRPPIVEAIVDIGCDLPPGFSPGKVEEAARASYSEHYPRFQKEFLQEHKFQAAPNEPPEYSVKNAIQGWKFFSADSRQVVQVRRNGYAFNRLAPYTSLDAYLPEIERTWKEYLKFAKPVQVRGIRLRYINRILLPMVGGRIVELDEYFRVGPRLPDEERLAFVGFVNQHTAVERESGHRVNIVLAAQSPEQEQLPVIFDNSAQAIESGEPDDWDWIRERIVALRSLKNHVFQNTLTTKCLSQFQA